MLSPPYAFENENSSKNDGQDSNVQRVPRPRKKAPLKKPYFTSPKNIPKNDLTSETEMEDVSMIQPEKPPINENDAKPSKPPIDQTKNHGHEHGHGHGISEVSKHDTHDEEDKDMHQ